jgi:hypothetical protein
MSNACGSRYFICVFIFCHRLIFFPGPWLFVWLGASIFVVRLVPVWVSAVEVYFSNWAVWDTVIVDLGMFKYGFLCVWR